MSFCLRCEQERPAVFDCGYRLIATNGKCQSCHEAEDSDYIIDDVEQLNKDVPEAQIKENEDDGGFYHPDGTRFDDAAYMRGRAEQWDEYVESDADYKVWGKKTEES